MRRVPSSLGFYGLLKLGLHPGWQLLQEVEERGDFFYAHRRGLGADSYLDEHSQLEQDTKVRGLNVVSGAKGDDLLHAGGDEHTGDGQLSTDVMGSGEVFGGQHRAVRPLPEGGRPLGMGCRAVALLCIWLHYLTVRCTPQAHMDAKPQSIYANFLASFC